jgi:hypothetical protein
MYPFAQNKRVGTKPELHLAKELRCVVNGWKEENGGSAP